MFRALVVSRHGAGDETAASVEMLAPDRLPDGDVTIAVSYSSLNYKDGLCLGPGGGGLVRTYPHVPGIDLAGVVESSSDPRFKTGDKVVLTGWRVGEAHWGGYAQKARVAADWLTPLPDGLDLRRAMAVGTAGVAAMLAVMALEEHGAVSGPILVTGASGGVGSLAVAILAQLGHEVIALTGRTEGRDYLLELGASRVAGRDEVLAGRPRPLESEVWAGCIDSVGGVMLARILAQMRYGASVAAVGLAGGADLPASVIPFLLRGINLLGIDSVMLPAERRIHLWQRIATDLPHAALDAMTQSSGLADLPRLGADIVKGRLRGRVVVDVNA